MYKNYFTTASRNFKKHKFFSFINIIGLTIGIAACLLLLQYTFFEKSYDNFHSDNEDIYRIRGNRYSNGKIAEALACASNPIGERITKDFPEILDFTRLSDYQLNCIFSYKDKKIRLNKGYYATSSFFNIFSFKLIKGNPETVLKDVETVVISQSFANKLFGEADPVGKTIYFNNKSPLIVTGIFEDTPENTHLKFEALISFPTMTKYYGDWVEKEWWVDIALTYIKLVKGTDPKKIEEKADKLIQERLGTELKAANQDMDFVLQPLADIHLTSHFIGEAEANGDKKSVDFLLFVSFLIIIIAWINYINLATARSLERGKECGLRKVLGASRNQLIKQFLFESLLINILSSLLAILIVYLINPYFANFTGLKSDLSLWNNFVFWITLSSVIITGALISGLYPAFIMSSFHPVETLKGTLNSSKSGLVLRKGLILFQFIISITLLSGTLTIINQVNYMLNKDLGFEIEQTLIIKGPVVIDSTWFSDQATLKNELLKSPNIKKICRSSYVPGDHIFYTDFYKPKNTEKDMPGQSLRVVHIDFDYPEFYNFKLLAGKIPENNRNNIQKNFINRAAVELYGFSSNEEAVGKILYHGTWDSDEEIVGVIENVNQNSLRNPYQATAYTILPYPNWAKNYSIKINSLNMPNTISEIQKKWEQFFPNDTFEYHFLDDNYNRQYKADIQFGRLFGIFTILSILINCLGLFALSLYVLVKRTKEIAIRKVLGASILDLIFTVSKEFVKLFLISAFIAIPVSFLIMNIWLNNYAWRINLGWWFYILPLSGIFLITCLTICYQILKISRTNPANSLKCE